MIREALHVLFVSTRLDDVDAIVWFNVFPTVKNSSLLDLIGTLPSNHSNTE